MDFREGTSVYTSDGTEGGRLHRVVIDPETHAVTHIVVQRGFLNKEDKVVAVEKIISALHDGVTLECSAEELNEMAPLNITHLVPMTGTGGSDTYISGAPGSFLNQSPEDYVVEETTRTIPEELVALKEGALVVSADDDQVGNVERVVTNPQTLQVTHFIVSQGLLHKVRKMVPIRWVSMWDEDKVFLEVGTQQLKELPEFEE